MTFVGDLLRRLVRRAQVAVCAALVAMAFVGAPAVEAQQRSGDIIQGILVEGNQRIESQTVLSYLTVAAGMPFDPAQINTSMEVLFDTGLFADIVPERRGNLLVIRVVENPIINRVTFEGNRAIDDEKLSEEIQAQPRAIFTRARVQADVQRMIEVYRQSGRFAAQITPRVVEQPQNRIDLVFEITEGPLTGVRRINFIGNEAFSDRRLRGEVVTRESRFWRFFSSNDNYDPARLEYDRELLREFYTDRGYADFRVVSAVAELTPDQEDFFITYVVDEGEVYSFGDIEVVSEIEVLDEDALEALVPLRTGQLYEQSRITDAEDALTFAAGAAGYAFVNIQRQRVVDRETRTVSFVFTIVEGPRVYIERIDVVGNTRTLDHVIRREVQLVEGDAFNRVLEERSRQRVRSLGFFEEVEIASLPGSQPDRAIMQVQVTEQPTGELNFGAGFSSVDAFLVDLSITERNLRGRGQFLRFRISASQRRQIVDIRFTEPRFLGRNIAAGFDIFNTRQDFLSEASFETRSTGASLNFGFPVTERASLRLSYTLRLDDVQTFAGASSPIALQSGERMSSIAQFALSWDRRDDPFQPTRGFVASVQQEFAGLGGDVKFLSSEFDGTAYRSIFSPQLVASLSMSGGYIAPWGGDEVRINDRFFKGGQSFRGFETAGMGPRVVQEQSDGSLISGDALGGQFFAIGTAELAFPLGLPEQYGIRGSLFSDFGYLGVLDDDDSLAASGLDIRDDLSLRASAGVSIFWRSPFGPIRFDFSEVLAAEEYDRTETFRFSTTTTF
ncbi:MAG: outer membrane protein assembly factor BamA [Maricaulaceae bacterium]|jgi:outer membrane protein insertion porin family